MNNTGITKNGTSWTEFSNGNVELIFANGSKTTINPTVLGLTRDDAIASFEQQVQTLNQTIYISDQEYLELIEDLLGELPSYNTIHDSKSSKGDQGIPNGLALLPIFMSLSKAGLSNLMSVMGFFPTPILNSLNQWVVGFQHILDDSELDFFNAFPMSLESAAQLLMQDVQQIFTPMIQNLIRVPITQQQFDSLIGSAATMGPTRFAQSGIPNSINSGDPSGAADIRECYNSTNGEYDPAKGFAANSQAMGLKTKTDEAGSSVIADPNLVNTDVGVGPATGSNSAMYSPAPGMVEAVNSSARTSTTMNSAEAAAALYGISHAESGVGNNLAATGSTASGPYHYTNGTWVEYVKQYGQNVPGLESYSKQLKANPNSIALKQQVLPFKNDPVLSSKITMQAIDNYYIPTLKQKGLPVTLGSIWNMHYLPGSVSQNVQNQYNWGAVNTGWQYASKYYR